MQHYYRFQGYASNESGQTKNDGAGQNGDEGDGGGGGDGLNPLHQQYYHYHPFHNHPYFDCAVGNRRRQRIWTVVVHSQHACVDGVDEAFLPDLGSLNLNLKGQRGSRL